MSVAGARVFPTLEAACAGDWQAFIGHPFVRQLGAGTLPRDCFAHYLQQDYLFLVHFARAYALAIYKSPDLASMRQAKDTLTALLDEEMRLHVEYCAGWGIDEETLQGTPEARANMAYTRYVLEVGHAGDVFDLHVALAPCVVGYAEVANALLASPDTVLDGNPYRSWIDMYAGAEYQAVADGARRQLDELAGRYGFDSRLARLQRVFADATRLEIGFWQMGLDCSY